MRTFSCAAESVHKRNSTRVLQPKKGTNCATENADKTAWQATRDSRTSVVRRQL